MRKCVLKLIKSIPVSKKETKKFYDYFVEKY